MEKTTSDPNQPEIDGSNDTKPTPTTTDEPIDGAVSKILILGALTTEESYSWSHRNRHIRRGTTIYEP